MENNQFNELWSARSTQEKWALTGAALVLLLTVVAAGLWAFWPRYEPLFNQLSAQQMTEVANQLAQHELRYRLDDDAGRVLVAKADVRKARALVLEQGLPMGRPAGFELFNDVQFGMTDFTQRINYQRALEGELTRTILSLDEVERVRLHLVLPEAGLFSREAAGAKASVALTLKPGRSLAPRQIHGIQRLLSASVPGLSAERVTIHDQRGASLVEEEPPVVAAQSATDAQLQARQQYEAHYAAKVREVVRQLAGREPALLMVNVETGALAEAPSPSLPVVVTSPAPSAPVVQETAATPAPASTAATSAAADAVPSKPATGESAAFRRAAAIERLAVVIALPGEVDDGLRGLLHQAVTHAIGLSESRGDVLSVLAVPAPMASPAWTAPLDAPPAVPVASMAGVDDARRWLFEVPWRLPAIAVLISLVTALVVLALAGGRRGAPRLDARQREALLQDLRGWVEDAQQEAAR